MAKLVEKVYGDALFEIGVQKKLMLPQLLEEMDFVRSTMKENPELWKLLNHPQIVKEEKLAVLERVFSSVVSREMTGFLRIVTEKDRQKRLFDIFDYFETRVKEYYHIGVVQVSVPMELTQVQKDRIEEKVLQTTPYNSLEVTYEVDPSLIGGMVIRIGDRVVDSSVKTRLYLMSRELSKIQLTEVEETATEGQKEGEIAP